MDKQLRIIKRYNKKTLRLAGRFLKYMPSESFIAGAVFNELDGESEDFYCFYIPDYMYFDKNYYSLQELWFPSTYNKFMKKLNKIQAKADSKIYSGWTCPLILTIVKTHKKPKEFKHVICYL